jgi:hypothetical protein
MKPTEEQLEAICVAMDPIPLGLELARAGVIGSFPVPRHD